MAKKYRNLLIIITILILGYGVISSSYHYISCSALTLGCIIAVEIFLKLCRVKVPPIMPISIYIFIFLSMTLGKTFFFYGIPHWDKFLHLTSGLLIALVGMVVLWSLNSKGPKLVPSVIIAFILAFSIASAGVWEIWEFTTDSLFGLTAQNNSLNDTMWDIICGTVGGSIVCIFLYLYYYKDKAFKFIKNTIDYMEEK